MKQAYIGVDVAIAKKKHLPVVICTKEEGRLTPLPLRRLGIYPPRGMGNAAALDRKSLHGFAREAAEYVRTACERLNLAPKCIGIDAPGRPCDPELPRRLAEVGLDLKGISCFATPTMARFELICAKVVEHLKAGGPEHLIPHSNQLWMLAGFKIFQELSLIAPCLEVFPNR